VRGRWVDDLIARTRSTVDDLLARADRRPVLGVTLRCVRDLVSVDVRDRIFGLTGQSFLALVPLMVIFASVLTFGNENLPQIINTRLRLDTGTAQTVSSLFTTDPTAAVGASALSAVILLLSVNSFTRTMRRSIERPWLLPKSGWRGQMLGLVAVAVFLVMHFSTAMLATAWRGGPVATAVPEVLAQTLVAVAFWWVISYLLAAGRVQWLHLLPGAAAGGVAQSLAGFWSVTFLPSILERDVDRYGSIGVALAIVTWLIVASGITVGVGIVGAQIARAAGWLSADPGAGNPA
jgi:membrane protein